jgi:hypothetical protein
MYCGQDLLTTSLSAFDQSRHFRFLFSVAEAALLDQFSEQILMLRR